MIECYYEGIKCKYSGISKFYPDPLERNFNDEFYKDYIGTEEFNKILKIREKYKTEKSKLNHLIEYNQNNLDNLNNLDNPNNSNGSDKKDNLDSIEDK